MNLTPSPLNPEWKKVTSWFKNKPMRWLWRETIKIFDCMRIKLKGKGLDFCVETHCQPKKKLFLPPPPGVIYFASPSLSLFVSLTLAGGFPQVNSSSPPGNRCFRAPFVRPATLLIRRPSPLNSPLSHKPVSRLLRSTCVLKMKVWCCIKSYLI